MSVGLSPTRSQLDAVAGDISRATFITLRRIETLKQFLDTKTVEDLEALGYTPDEVALLKTAVDVLDDLRLVFEGGAGPHERRHARVSTTDRWFG